MNPHGLHLSRPVYEALPWVYVLCGLAALIASYFHESRALSLLVGLPGLLCVLGGVVVMLRRRGFRQMRANNYLNTDSTLPPESGE